MMTPTRLRECLDALRWSQRALADNLGVSERIARRWAAGSAIIPGPVASWLESATFHVAPMFDAIDEWFEHNKPPQKPKMNISQGSDIHD